eukprot:Skav218838  [mRNA]  locus=scaffold3029:168060:169055:- [translate_table: standard]
MSKSEMNLILSCLNANPQDQAYLIGADAEFRNTHPVQSCHIEIEELEDQHVFLGWCLLDWFVRKSLKQSATDLGINCIDPIISYYKQIFSEEEAQCLDEGVKAAWESSSQLLFIPVYAQYHWTLLVAERASEGIRWRRYDSLSKEHTGSHEMQIQMGKLLDTDFQLPPLTNKVTQPDASRACGSYILHYMEQEMRSKMFKTPSIFSMCAKAGSDDWKKRLRYMTEKLRSQAAEMEMKVSFEDNVLQEKRKEAQNLDTFTWQNLSQASVDKVFVLKDAKKFCSKCRWTSCIKCDPRKRLKYQLYKEAQANEKLASLLTGPRIYDRLINEFVK